VFATEVIEYRNLSSEIKNEPDIYYSEFLPSEIYWSINNYLMTHEGPFWGTTSSEGNLPETGGEQEGTEENTQSQENQSEEPSS